MSDLAQIALEFARECLGWEQDKCHIMNGEIWAPPGKANFNPKDLNAVMEAVQGWCACHKLAFTLCCDESGFEVAVFSVSFEEVDEEAISSNLCHALLAACIEASRKMKGAV